MKRPSTVLSYTAWQRLRCLTRHLRASAEYLAGFNPPDLRDQDLKDRGAELEWRVSGNTVIAYRGQRGGVVHRVHENGQRSLLDPRLDLKTHSLAGFGWGYGGSGPSQLAIAVLADVTGDDQQALEHYHAFKWAVIADLTHQEPFVIDADAVLGWLRQQRDLPISTALAADQEISHGR